MSAAAHADLLKRHQSALEAMFPGTVTISGRVHPCAVHMGQVAPKLQDDGVNYRNGQDVILYIAKDRLPNAPAPRSEITIGGVVYRVVNSGAQKHYDNAWRITARRYV